MSDIVERLRYWRHLRGSSSHSAMLDEAADEIERLRAANAELAEALRAVIHLNGDRQSVGTLALQRLDNR